MSIIYMYILYILYSNYYLLSLEATIYYIGSSKLPEYKPKHLT